MRADLFLVEHGFATTRSQAQRLIGAGAQWRVDEGVWKKVAKNGDEVPDAAELQLLDTREAKYISRGGLKLEGALARSGVPVNGLRCLDIGQSTGGFTDCLLQHGAVQVVGVDVGHGQLHDSLRIDPRVVCIEGVNARALTADDLAEHYRRALQGGDDGDGDDQFDDYAEFDDLDFDPAFDFLTGDLSFISLTLVLPAVVRLLKPDGHLLMLVKPQFELQPGQIGKGGIVRDAELFESIEKRLRDCCTGLGLQVLAWLESPIAGGDGNREFFIHAKKGQERIGEDQPLATAPQRKAAKRLPRSVLRESREIHQSRADAEAAHAGQHGPARGKRRDPKSGDDASET
jgi:23S rRNA (cytidine1920-2'-O)/16S rRNA (cytidine1409-2'-O)-methyltransferase